MAGRWESSSVSPPQRLGRQPLQQAEPAPLQLGLTGRPLRRLPVQQQLKLGLRIHAHAAVSLQSPPVHFPTHPAQGCIAGPGGRVPLVLRRQDGREGLYQIPNVVNGGDEDGGLQSAEERPGLHERAVPLHPPPHTDLPHLLAARGPRVRRQPVPPGEPAGSVQLHPQEQRQDPLLHR